MNEQTNTSNNSEIDKALKQFEAESQTGQPQKSPEALKASPIAQREVEGIQFEIPSYGAARYYKETDTPKMVKLVMKLSGGAIKEQKQAEYFLLGLVVVAIGVSLYLVVGVGHKQPQTTPAMIEQMRQSVLNSSKQ